MFCAVTKIISRRIDGAYGYLNVSGKGGEHSKGARNPLEPLLALEIRSV